MNTQFGAVILSTLAVVVVDQQDSSFIAWERFYARSVFVREGEEERAHNYTRRQNELYSEVR